MTTQAAHPFQLTAPTEMTVAPNTSGTFTVTNSGTKALTVHEQLGRYNEHSIQYPAADHATVTTMGHPWLTIAGPASFTLAPGQVRTVHIASHVPAGAQGNHYLNVVWIARPAHPAPGAFHLAGAVATNVVIPLPGIAQPVTSQGMPRALPAPHHGGLSAMDLAGVGLAAAIVASVTGLVIRRRRRNRRARVQAQEVTA